MPPSRRWYNSLRQSWEPSSSVVYFTSSGNYFKLPQLCPLYLVQTLRNTTEIWWAGEGLHRYFYLPRNSPRLQWFPSLPYSGLLALELGATNRSTTAHQSFVISHLLFSSPSLSLFPLCLCIHYLDLLPIIKYMFPCCLKSYIQVGPA